MAHRIEPPQPGRRQLLLGTATVVASVLYPGTMPPGWATGGAVLPAPRARRATGALSVLTVARNDASYMALTRESPEAPAVRRWLEADGAGSLWPGEPAAPGLADDVDAVALAPAGPGGWYVAGTRLGEADRVPTLPPGAVTGWPEGADADSEAAVDHPVPEDLLDRLAALGTEGADRTGEAGGAERLPDDAAPADNLGAFTAPVPRREAVLYHDVDGELHDIELPEALHATAFSTVEALAVADGGRSLRALVAYGHEPEEQYAAHLALLSVRDGQVTDMQPLGTDLGRPLGESGPNHLVERRDGGVDIVINHEDAHSRLVTDRLFGGARSVAVDRAGRVATAIDGHLEIQGPEGGARWESPSGRPLPSPLEAGETDRDGAPRALPVVGSQGRAAAHAAADHLLLFDL